MAARILARLLGVDPVGIGLDEPPQRAFLFLRGARLFGALPKVLFAQPLQQHEDVVAPRMAGKTLQPIVVGFDRIDADRLVIGHFADSGGIGGRRHGMVMGLNHGLLRRMRFRDRAWTAAEVKVSRALSAVPGILLRMRRVQNFERDLLHQLVGFEPRRLERFGEGRGEGTVTACGSVVRGLAGLRRIKDHEIARQIALRREAAPLAARTAHRQRIVAAGVDDGDGETRMRLRQGLQRVVELERLYRQIALRFDVGVGADEVIDELGVLHPVAGVIEQRDRIGPTGAVGLGGFDGATEFKQRAVQLLARRVLQKRHLEAVPTQPFGDELRVGDGVFELFEVLILLYADDEREAFLDAFRAHGEGRQKRGEEQIFEQSSHDVTPVRQREISISAESAFVEQIPVAFRDPSEGPRSLGYDAQRLEGNIPASQKLWKRARKRQA